jgi:hypothetical protein
MAEPISAEPRWKVEECRSCYRPIIWAVTVRGKSMPVDAEPPTQGGNVDLVGHGTDARPLAKVLNTTQQFGRTGLRLSHFASCPNADRHRAAGRGRP